MNFLILPYFCRIFVVLAVIAVFLGYAASAAFGVKCLFIHYFRFLCGLVADFDRGVRRKVGIVICVHALSRFEPVTEETKQINSSVKCISQEDQFMIACIHKSTSACRKQFPENC